MTLSVCKSQSRQQIDAVSCVCKLSKASIETCKLWSAQLFSREYKRAAQQNVKCTSVQQRLQTRCPAKCEVHNCSAENTNTLPSKMWSAQLFSRDYKRAAQQNVKCTSVQQRLQTRCPAKCEVHNCSAENTNALPSKMWSAQLFSREYKRAAQQNVKCTTVQQRIQTRCPETTNALPSSALRRRAAQFCTVLHKRPSSARSVQFCTTAQFCPTLAQFCTNGPVLAHWPSSAQTAQFCPTLAQFCTNGPVLPSSAQTRCPVLHYALKQWNWDS